MGEQNQGHEIIAAEVYAVDNYGRQARIVLAHKDTQYGPAYVTWESTISADGSSRDYFWGHYFSNEREARADYHRRLLSYYER